MAEIGAPSCADGDLSQLKGICHRSPRFAGQSGHRTEDTDFMRGIVRLRYQYPAEELKTCTDPAKRCKRDREG